MSGRELTALGTGSLVPTPERNHSGHFLRWGATGVLFDPGEGTQRQMTLAGVPARRIRIICLTHLHGDHRDLHSFPTRHSSDLSACPILCRGLIFAKRWILKLKKVYLQELLDPMEVEKVHF